ncbi:MAG: cytochrome c [Halieaceae bacterium]
MTSTLRQKMLILATVSGLAISPLAISHFDDSQIPQSYRQSYFALLAGNFGPMAAMMKGEIPWNQEQFAAYSADLSAVATLNVERGFQAGSDKGTTRAKPEIWSNMADFESKLGDMRSATAALEAAAASGDKEQITQAFGQTGKSCKSCHDEYKSKDYLY